MTIFMPVYDGGHFRGTVHPSILRMIWMMMVMVLLMLLFLLLSPVELKIDSRVPVISLRWKGIGEAILMYEEEWWLKIRLPFFQRKWSFMELILSDKKRKPEIKSVQDNPGKRGMRFGKIKNILKSFRVKTYEVAVCHSDDVINGRWYFLNFMPGFRQHVFVNFTGENYFILVIKNNAWRCLNAFIKK